MPPDFAERLRSGERIEEPVAIVVAHPDDESLWLGTALERMPNATLIHLTDGAPEDMRDAARLGFQTREAYAAARARELGAALATLGVEPRRIGYGYVDQSLVVNLRELVERLCGDLAGMSAVVTHPYEGGHPDHDAAALAVRRAFAGEVTEFACYHWTSSGRVYGRFWPRTGSPERIRPMSERECARASQAIAAHETQADVIAAWRPVEERWRMAPAYDFTAPPPPGKALYDDWGWELTSAQWRELAARC